MRAVLRLEVVGARRFDAQLATIGESRLIRTPQGSYLEVDVTSVVAAVRSSALAGVRAIACDRDFTPGVDTMRAVAARARLRPVVFDRDGLDRAPFRWTHASDGAIARWLFA